MILLHLALKVITFRVSPIITFSVKIFIRLVSQLLHLALNFITFRVGITFSVDFYYI